MTHRTPKTVFLLGNGRSGTRFLCGLFRNNAADCTAIHEPYLRRGRPSMFGLPIYDYAHGLTKELRRAWETKRRGILSYRTQWYVETNHAFIMSFADLAIESFPDMKLVHVIRNPLNVCASQAERLRFIDRYLWPVRSYRGRNGRWYFRWGLTGDEPIFQHFAGEQLTSFQRFVVQWIELENRAQAFLDRYQKRNDCFVLHTPGDLNKAERVTAMFQSLGIPLRQHSVQLQGEQNRTPGDRRAADENLLAELQAIVDRLPAQQLEIFSRAPYRDFPWSNLLQKLPQPVPTSTEKSAV